jgi:peptidyl-prolyl cis-trans isomerase D
MIASLRAALNTWVVRALFLILVVAFAAWGVGDMIRVIGTDTAVASVAGEKLQLPLVQEAYQQELAQFRRARPNEEPTLAIRQQLAEQALQRLITQTVIAKKVAELGLQTPDEAVRAAVLAIPGMRKSDGTLDRIALERLLSSANLSEQRFLELMRSDLSQEQLLSAVHAGAVAPDVLVHAVYAFRNEKRVAMAVRLPFAAAPAPPSPTEAELTRYWANHPEKFGRPEYRRIKAVILTPEAIAKTLPVSEEEIAAAYESRKAEFDVPEKRSVQIILAPNEARAKALAEQWRAGADWATIEKAAKTPDGNAVTLDNATRAEIPVPQLADEVFKAPLNVISAPIKTDLGYYVVRVTAIHPGGKRTLAEVKNELRQQVALQKAADVIYDRANKVEDLLAGGAKLDELPGDLGLAAVTGTLDAQGLTPQGVPAPIPGPEELRKAVVEAAFQTKPGDPPRLVEVPASGGQGASSQASSYYALVVESITPPAEKPFAEVRAEVEQAYKQDAMRHEQEAVAAKLYAAVKDGKPLSEAAKAAGLEAQMLPPAGRGSATPGVPVQLSMLLFSMKRGEATMVETEDSFVVAQLMEIQKPDPKADPVAYGRMRDQLTRQIANDLDSVYVIGLREAAKPRVNEKLLETIAQP